MNRREGGSALIESVLLGLVLLVPLVWALTVLAELHKTALAATAAVREAGFDAARAGDLVEADRAVTAAVTAAFADHGLDPARARVAWAASPRLERGAYVEVSVSFPVAVGTAPVIGSVGGPNLWVRAGHVARIDPYRSRE